MSDALRIIYDGEKRRITLGTDELLEHGEIYAVLTPWEAIIVKAIKKSTSGFKKCATAADLVLQDDIQRCSQAIIRNILNSLVKKGILEEEEDELRDRKISVFKVR